MQERYAGLKLYAKHLPSHTQTWSRADIIFLTFISLCLSFSFFTPSFCSNYTSLADSRSPKDKLIVRKSAINQPKSRIQEREVPSIIPSLPIVPKDFFSFFLFLSTYHVLWLFFSVWENVHLIANFTVYDIHLLYLIARTPTFRWSGHHRFNVHWMQKVALGHANVMAFKGTSLLEVASGWGVGGEVSEKREVS